MQYIALNAATIVAGDGKSRLVSGARISYPTEQAQPAFVLHSRFYYPPSTDRGGSFSHDPADEDWASGENASGMSGWKRVITWSGAALACWGMVIGLVALVRALL